MSPIEEDDTEATFATYDRWLDSTEGLVIRRLMGWVRELEKDRQQARAAIVDLRRRVAELEGQPPP